MKKNVSFKIETNKIAILDEIAKGLGTTRASLLRMIVLKGIKHYEESGKNPNSFLERG